MLKHPGMADMPELLEKLDALRKEGTKNYYYFDPETESFEKLISTLQLAREITMSLPDRSGNNE